VITHSAEFKQRKGIDDGSEVFAGGILEGNGGSSMVLDETPGEKTPQRLAWKVGQGGRLFPSVCVNHGDRSF
jgi:hypothetical protein